MNVVRSGADLREVVAEHRAAGDRIGFVATMGALHEGHLSLVSAAIESGDIVVLSIFVNPLQFGPTEDLAAYPRDERRDLALAEEAGVDVAFLPSVHEMYPGGQSTTVDVGDLGTVLEGVDRPGHFNGVATVVAKLFNMVAPDIALFGQKDAQQVAVIRRLVRDLSFPIEIQVEPTVREPDGLALSSRNVYLTPDERSRATAIYRALLQGAAALSSGGPEQAEKDMWELLVAEGLVPSYAMAVDPVTFTAPEPEGPVLLVVAARLGRTRLIDNLLVETR